MRNKLSRRSGHERGAALLEFAVVLPVFVLILYALIGLGVALSTKHSVTSAASEGARAAVGAPDYTAAKAAAQNRITNALGAANGRYTVCFAGDAAPCPAITPTAGLIEVTVTWDYAGHPVMSAPGLDMFMPKTLTSKAVVQYS